jgi:mRNA interferase YafQ
MREEIQVKFSPDFLRAYGRLRRRGAVVIEDLDYAAEFFSAGEPLPDSWKDHALMGEWSGHREFHLSGAKNTLVIYRRRKNEVFFVNIGGHEELFAHRKRKEKGRVLPEPKNFPDPGLEGTAHSEKKIKKWWRGKD